MSLSLRFVCLLPLVGISPACPGVSTPEEPAARADTKPEQVTTEPSAADALAEPEEPPAPPARKVSSGLDLGMKFEPFEVKTLAGSESSCRVCELREAGKRVLLIHGSLEDPHHVELLLDLQALGRRYREPGFEILALVSDPVEVATARAEDLAKRRRLELDLYRIADAQTAWTEHYQVDEPYTVMFADPNGEVLFSGVDPQPLDELDEAIRASGLEVEMLERAAD